MTEAGDPGHASLEAADVDYHFAYGIRETAIYATEMITYSEVLSSGRLGLIDDARIRRSLAHYERSFQLSQKIFNDVFEQQQIKVDPYMLGNLNRPQLVREQASRRKDRLVDLKLIVPARDHRLLLQNEQFQNQVTANFFLPTEYRTYTDGVMQVLNDLAMLVWQRT